MRPTGVLSLCFIAVSLAGCAAQPQNPSFPITDDQASKVIWDMWDHPQPLDRPLVIISGFLDETSSPIYAGFFSSITRNAKIIPVVIGTCNSFDECRQKVIDAVDKECPSNDPRWTTTVDVVGLSLGGVVARYAAIPSPDPAHPRQLRIARLFSISSPHSGAKLAQIIAFNQFHRDLRPGSEFLNHLALYDHSATYQLFAYVHLNDEIVGDYNAAPPHENPYWLSNPWPLPPHLAAMIDTRIIADISRRLRGEPAFTLSPPAPLPL